jgi:MFS family permease
MQWLRRIREPLRDPDFRRLTAAMSVYTFAVGLTALGIVYLKKDFHVSYTHLSLLSIFASVSTIVFSFAWGYALDRMGGRAFGAIMVILAPLVMTVWFFVRDYSTNLVDLCQGVWGLGAGVSALVKLLPAGMEAWVNGLMLPQPVWLLLFANVFAGALFGGITLCQLSLASGLVPEKGRTMAMAVYWSTIGLVGSLGLLAAGWVMDYFQAHPIGLALPNGTPMAFHHVLVLAQMLLLWTGVLPPLLAIRKRAGEPGVGAAFSQLLLANPFRMASNIYTMGASVTSGLRARAVHNLGEHRARIAVSDLIERLDDASVEVREEAAYALGSIGSPEAIDALLLRLEDRNSDLAPQIARALRYTRSLEREKTVPALLRRLRDPDRETKTETARTLGKIGDRRAVPSLMDVLSESRDAKVVSASSEALSRLGEVAAIYAILPRMKEAANPVLKRSLAVAIGDLLGEPEGFYKVFTKEQYRRGS